MIQLRSLDLISDSESPAAGLEQGSEIRRALSRGASPSAPGEADGVERGCRQETRGVFCNHFGLSGQGPTTGEGQAEVKRNPK